MSDRYLKRTSSSPARKSPNSSGCPKRPRPSPAFLPISGTCPFLRQQHCTPLAPHTCGLSLTSVPVCTRPLPPGALPLPPSSGELPLRPASGVLEKVQQLALQNGKIPIWITCWFLWCKHSHDVPFQTSNGIAERKLEGDCATGEPAPAAHGPGSPPGNRAPASLRAFSQRGRSPALHSLPCSVSSFSCASLLPLEGALWKAEYYCLLCITC